MVPTAMLHSIWIVLPPWAFAVVVTALGHYGEGWLLRVPTGATGSAATGPPPISWGDSLITNLVFLSLLPTLVLSFFQLMLPFESTRAGLAMGIAAFAFGCAPVRLLDHADVGWDRTAWRLLVDLVRVGGALMLVGWLVGP